MNFDSIVKVIRGLVKLRGGTDGAVIGNTGDRLKVDAQITSINGATSSPHLTSKLRYLDMNVANGGVARNTLVTSAAWVNVFSYSGSGLLTSFVLNLEYSDNWEIRLVLDGEDIFDTSGLSTSDLSSNNLYDLDIHENNNYIMTGIGLSINNNNLFQWSSPLNLPSKYTSSVVIKIKRKAGESSKKFQAGLVVLTKET